MDTEPLNHEGPMAADVVQLVSDFLRKPITTDGDWPVLSDEDWKEIHEVFYQIIEAKFQRDCDNDQVIEYALCNRKNNTMSVINVPYDLSTDKDMERGMHAISTASGIIERLTHTMGFVLSDRRRETIRRKKMEPVLQFCAPNGHRPPGDRIKNFVEGDSPSGLFIGNDDTVWEPLGLTCVELKQVLNDNIGVRNMRENIEDFLIDAVNRKKGDV